MLVKSRHMLTSVVSIQNNITMDVKCGHIEYIHIHTYIHGFGYVLTGVVILNTYTLIRVDTCYVDNKTYL